MSIFWCIVGTCFVVGIALLVLAMVIEGINKLLDIDWVLNTAFIMMLIGVSLIIASLLTSFIYVVIKLIIGIWTF